MLLGKTELLVETVQKLSLARDMDTLMKVVRSAARQLTGADGATFVLKENGLCYYAEEDAISPLWKGQRFPMEACISGWAMVNKKAAVIEDIYADSRILADAYKPTFVKSLAMVPIRTMEPIGAIGNYWAKTHMATDEEVFLLQSLADITSVSIENVYVYAELEQRVKERTKELEDAIKTLQTFNYAVSHDLRAPLRGFKGFVQNLKEDHGNSLDDDGKYLIDRLEISAENLNELLEGLLEFSKTGGKQLELQQTNMAEMVGAISRDLKSTEPERDITFDIKNLPSVVADPLLIRQVWFNLLSNAVKYTGKKATAKIEVGAYVKDNEVCYYVKDNGSGFDMKYYDKLFGIFQRLHSQEDFNGHGVGLALVERIIARHDGKVWAESKPDEGATFYFTIPAKVQV